MATSLEQALDAVSQLSPEQQMMLVEIVRNRLIEARRQEISRDAEASIAAFHRGEFQPQSAQGIITELQNFLREDA